MARGSLGPFFLVFLLFSCLVFKPAAAASIYMISLDYTADQAARNALVTAGHTVEYRTPCTNWDRPTILSGSYDMLLIGSSCGSGDIRSLSDIDLPAACWEQALYGNTAGDWGFGTTKLTLALPNPGGALATAFVATHPVGLSTGLTPGQVVTLSSQATTSTAAFGGTFGLDVQPLLVSNDANQNGLFAVIEKGGRTSGGVSPTAPHRRLALPFYDDTVQFAPPEALRVLTDSVAWMAAKVNAAPSLACGATRTLGTVVDTTADPAGVSVSSVMGSQAVFSDPDSSLFTVAKGLAIVQATDGGGADGTWQWRASSTAQWQSITPGSSVMVTAAIVIGEASQVRFVPVAGKVGTFQLQVCAWDRSNVNAAENVDGAVVDASSRGAAAPYSTMLCPLEVTVQTATTGTTGTTAATTTSAPVSSTTNSVPATTATTDVPTTTGIPTTTGVPTTTNSPPAATTAEKATDASSTNADAFPFWIIIVAVAACCCCIMFIIVAVLILQRRKRRSPSADNDDSSVELADAHPGLKDELDIADDELVESEYDAISRVQEAGKLEAEGYAPVTDVVSEFQYAAIPKSLQAGVVSEYARIPREGVSEALCDTSDDLDPNEVMVLKDTVVGKGSQGDVFRGRYRGVDIAVKMLKKGYTEEQLQAFFDEAALFARVPPHENVVGFIGACPDPFMIITE
jgi:Protein tyrosine and serine/threonine kinase